VQVIADLDPWALEGELLDRIAAAKAASPLAPVLVIVPTSRLADHVRKRLVERFGAILGVDVLTHRALAMRVLDAAGVGAPNIAHDALLLTLARRIFRESPPGALRDFVLDRPGALVALHASLRDLRETGLSDGVIARALGPEYSEISSLHSRYAAGLKALSERGWVDDAGLAGQAAVHSAAFAARHCAILHHGAYDLNGAQASVVRALDDGGALTFLLPGDADSVTGEFTLARLAIVSGTERPALERVVGRAGGRFGRRLRMLYDESAHPEAVAGDTVRLAHAAGFRAELGLAVKNALGAVARGVPPGEVAIVTRTLSPYAGAIEDVVDGIDVRWDVSFESPLRRAPWIGAALAALPAAIGARGAQPWGVHAAEIEEALGAVPSVGERDDEAWARLRGLLGTMAAIETGLDEREPVPAAEALAWLEAAVDATTIPPPGGRGSGIRVIDAMQARGLTFHEVVLVGMNASLFPRTGGEDPFLPDDARARLLDAGGVAPPTTKDRDAEERLLLAMTLGSCRDAIRVSWCRADESGRPAVPSLALREIGRIALGTADLPTLTTRARAIPAHPRPRLEALAADPGLLAPGEEALLVALAAEDGADATSALLARRDDLAAGAALIAATESFEPGRGDFDGRTGGGGTRGRISVTALESFGRCPLRFFFARVLRVPAPAVPPSPFEVDRAARGDRVHGVLSEVYRALRDRGSFEEASLDERIDQARVLLREAWRSGATADAGRTSRVPLLVEIEESMWMGALDSFLATDLARMHAGGWLPEEIEHERSATLSATGGELPLFTARLDRVLAGPDGRLIGDYKTGGFADRLKQGAMLNATQLQVALYQILFDAPVELLGVAPHHADDTAGALDDSRFRRFDGFKTATLCDGFVETVRVLAAGSAAGAFPIRPSRRCRTCEYRVACRKGHPPTEFREEHAADARDLRDVWAKSTKKPTLAAVRDGGSA
jgi:RecB family exonuclease